MVNPIKILISTDSAVAHSGLASTTRNIFFPLLRRYPNKYHIVQLGFFHFNPKENVPWQIIPTKILNTPNGPQLDEADKYGEKTFDEIITQVKPDIVMGYGDLWHFAPTLHSIYRNTYRLLVYYTIDGQPYFGHLDSKNNTAWGSALAKADQIVVLSHFGKEVLEESCPEIKDKEIKVMYHPMDLSKYPPITPEKKQLYREQILGKILGDPENFLCGFVGRNQFRKQNYKLWELAHYIVHGDYIQCKDCNRVTVKEWNFSKRDVEIPDNLTMYETGYDYSYCWYCRSSNIKLGIPNPKFYLWMHSPRTDPGYNFELQENMWRVSQNCIYTPANNQHISREQMIRIMSCFDIGYYPSGGEGFGNFSSELLALGIPMVYSNYSSHAEICEQGGLPVRVTYIPEIIHGIQRSAVDNGHAVEQVLKLMEDKKLRNDLGESGRRFISNFDLDTMADTWDKIFTELASKPIPLHNNTFHGGIV